MGISGLLPALKSIHVTRHLSEYHGKTIAVDAYVWLHKGVYACATELAMGKSTNKYVDYAMHRVRLMRHHNVEPYVVFDGGPLPAKKGTEHERKQRRDEHLARGKAFAAQGRHTQARECFIKCIDVTPQMAYQFIKALKAEGVSYVVAPYEADAQLTYLERIGLVDGILTEDSDLLVFGCKTVLFKLDPVAATVVSISRKDFGSVAASASDSNGISLIGWSDVQFRAMAILSGCDYLPSIPGIGLKTACNLLRKWKTPEQAVRAIALEGRKAVPAGYWKQFLLADRCFLHQRVYCPRAQRLVHLTQVDGEWDEEFDSYVGSDIDATLAREIALGDADPISRSLMIDINPSYVPHGLKQRSKVSNSANKGKGKMPESASNGGILSFFGPNPIIPPRLNQPAPAATTVKPSLAGKASGKRTLAEAMEHDMTRKKKLRQSLTPPRPTTHSKFFCAGITSKAGGVQRRHSDGVVSTAGPSRIPQADKENVFIMVEDDDEELPTSEPDLDGSDLSMKAQYDPDAQTDLDVDEFQDVVEQEDGYISPSPSFSKEVQDLSSPVRPDLSTSGGGEPGQGEEGNSGVLRSDDEADFGVDPISSPVSAVKQRTPFPQHRSIQETPTRGVSCGNILVHPTPTPERNFRDGSEIPSPVSYRADLRDIFIDDGETELSYIARDPPPALDPSGSLSPPSPSPETPNADRGPAAVPAIIDVDAYEYDLDEVEDHQERAQANRSEAVMAGWRDRWALAPPKKAGKAPDDHRAQTPRIMHDGNTFITPGSGASRVLHLKRSETNVTPAGRHSLMSAPRSAPSKPPVGKSAVKSTVKPRRSLVFETAKRTATPTAVRNGGREVEWVDLTGADSLREANMNPKGKQPASAQVLCQDSEDDLLSRSRMRFAQFRCP